ncbi:MAG: YgiT-type zinc finger protein [Blastocatellia bacterium]|nr:YgiT-type zinc finger protein [Blastocatellia bacterium]
MKTKAAKAKGKNNSFVIQCEYCNVKAARVEKLNHTFGKGSAMIVVTDVDTVVCDNCGRHYFEGATLKKLDEVLAHPNQYAVRESINVASLSSV